MKNYRSLQILLLLIVCVCKAEAGNPILFHNYSTEKGLPNAKVLSVGQDHEGFLWFGTKNGLSRYDGYDYLNFFHSDKDSTSLKCSWVNSLLCDSEGKLWVGTSKGLDLYEPLSRSFTHVTYSSAGYPDLSSLAVRCLHEDSRGWLWIGTMDGLVRLDRNRIFSEYYPMDDFPGRKTKGIIRCVDEDFLGNIWIGTFDGLFRYNPSTDEIIPSDVREIRPFVPENNLVLSLLPDPDNPQILWVGTETGLHRLDVLSGSFTSFSKDGRGGLSNNVIKSIEVYDENYLLLGTDDGLNLFDRKDWTADHLFHDFYDHMSLCNDIVHDIFRDQDSNLWFATSNGISSVVSSEFNLQMYEVDRPDGKNPVSENAVKEVLCTESGVKYILLKDRILCEEPDGKRSDLRMPPDFSARIADIHLDDDGIFWAATSNSLWYMEPGTRIFRQIHSGNLRYTSTIIPDPSGGVWVDSVKGLCHVYPEFSADGKISAIRKEDCDSIHSSVNILFADGEDTIWLQGKGPKIFRFSMNDHRVERISSDVLPSEIIFSSGADSGQAYLLSEQGLFYYDEASSSLKKADMDGFPDIRFSSIAADASGNIWLSADHQLFRLDSRQGSTRIYDLSPYLDDNAIVGQSLTCAPSGEIWIGASNRYFSFRPCDSYLEHADNTVAFSFLEINDEPQMWDCTDGQSPAITLEHNRNDIRIGFSTLTYSNPSGINYAYQLEGFDKEWKISCGNNQVHYSNLSPGKYRFKVRVLDAGQTPGPASLMKVKILRPWWRSSLAYAVYAVLFLGVFWLSVWLERRRMQRAERLRYDDFRRKANEELVQYKLRFFTNVSHELRTPLTLILGPLDAVMQKEQDVELTRYLSVMKTNAQRLLRMVNQIMDFSRLTKGRDELHLSEGDAIHFLRKVSEMFSSEASSRDISYQFVSEISSYYTCFDEDKLEKSVYNLLSNAFKYTPDNGRISISVKPSSCFDGHGLAIAVADSGKGIPEQEMEAVFHRFYQSPQTAGTVVGTGIGLSLVKDFTELAGGKVSVANRPEGGTVFTIDLPLERKVLDDPVLDAGQDVSLDADSSSPTILIVDDNLEMCSFLQMSLEADFQVILAHDGEEGLEKVRLQNPDIVVSDLMMPVMDGLEFCRKMKEDESMSYIPFILLTAKDGQDNVYEGLKNGADEYIAKPFNIQLLRLKLEKIIANRNRLREKLRNSLQKVEKPDEEKEQVINPFVDKVVEVIREHISDENLDTEKLADFMRLEKRQLYRKVKALTGMTLVELIRSVRLKEAAVQLEKTDATISEIMYGVGFSGNSYFAKCFSEQFECSPSEYRKRFT